MLKQLNMLNRIFRYLVYRLLKVEVSYVCHLIESYEGQTIDNKNLIKSMKKDMEKELQEKVLRNFTVKIKETRQGDKVILEGIICFKNTIEQ